MMFFVAALAVIVGLALVVARGLLGPTLFDRVLAVNFVGTGAILLLALVGFIVERPDFLDIGIMYALLNIIATLAVLKFFRYGDLSSAETEEEDRRGL